MVPCGGRIARPEDALPKYHEYEEHAHLFGDLTPVDLPGRAPHLPHVYRYVGSDGAHPLRHLQTAGGNSYVYLLDGTTPGLERALVCSLIGDVPKGSAKRMRDMGK